MYALVNNAGTGHSHAVDDNEMLKTNLFGAKSINDALIPMINPKVGRIINVGSYEGPGYVSMCEDEEKEFLSSKQVTWDELVNYITTRIGSYDTLEAYCTVHNNKYGYYGMTKAALHKYTEIVARENPNLKINTVSPAFCYTLLTRGHGARKKPE